MKRECGKCGNQTFDKGRLVMSDEVIRFQTEAGKDPVLTAFVCKQCGNVELSLEKRDKDSALFKTIDLAIESHLTEKFRGPFTKHDSMTLSNKELQQETGFTFKELEQILPKYLEIRKTKPLGNSSRRKFYVTASKKKDSEIIVTRWFDPHGYR